MIIDQLQQKNYKSGMQFSIPDLFTAEEWKSFQNTVSIGRTFRIAEKKPNNIVSNNVTFINKKSGSSAIYKVK